MRCLFPSNNPLRTLAVGLLATATVACVKTDSSLQVNSINTEGSAIKNHCGWVTVTEEETIKFLGATISVENRQFHESFFYCCPGDDGKAPVCYETRWLGR